ncbi:ribosylnicotinamide kinase [Ceratobasidium sp. 428]|nr:ribosylnicotinamide kinase [Ceratobasidium sp. 428]
MVLIVTFSDPCYRGGTCSGKTTLAKQLSAVLPNCAILNQDRYCTPEAELPIHPVHKVPDTDDADTAIRWPEFRVAFEELVKQGKSSEASRNGSEIESSSSFGYLSDEFLDQWRERFAENQRECLARGVTVEWRIVEGFIVFYDPVRTFPVCKDIKSRANAFAHEQDIYNSIGLKIFIRAPGPLLKSRREARKYTNSDGSLWVPPPNYWEHIAYPAYIRAHAPFFEGGDVETGRCTAPGLLVLETQGSGDGIVFEELFNLAAEAVLSKSRLDLHT